MLGAAGRLASCRRAQSVLDLPEVDVRFTLCGFAKGDDADFIFCLRVDYRYRYAREQAESLEPLLAVAESVIFNSVRSSFKDARRIDEVKAVILEIDCALTLGPREPHHTSVATLSSYDKRK